MMCRGVGWTLLGRDVMNVAALNLRGPMVQDLAMAERVAPSRWEVRVPRIIRLTAVGLGLVLAGLIWLTRDAVERASFVQAEGHAISLVQATNDELRHRRGDPGEALRRLLEREYPHGLRYVAILNPWSTELRIDFDAGTPIAPIDFARFADAPPFIPVPVGGRLRVHTIPPHLVDDPLEGGGGPPGLLPEHRPEGGPPMDHGPHGRPPFGAPFPRDDAMRFRGPPPGEPSPLGRGGPPGPPRIVLEFEPIAVNQLRVLARFALWGGGATVPLFIGGAFVLAYLIGQHERLQREREEDRRLAALGQMSAVIAHEIRNPLTSLKGHAQLLQESLGEDPRTAKVDRVVGEAIRLENLVSDLLDFARANEPKLEAIDPGQLLREAAAEVGADSVVIDVTRAPSSWPLDPIRMRQVLTNVLRNGIQSNPPDALVETRAEVVDEQLVFEIRDHGPGLAPGDESRIFEPFFTRKVRGTGLGLALVQRLVTQHGGRVVARNAAGGGAVFRITIPRDRGELTSNAGSEAI